MDVVESLKLKIQKACASLGQEVALNDIVIERTKDTAHGDYATNAAMKFSRLFGMNPRLLAESIIKSTDLDGIDHIEIAGPGFINFFMKNDSLTIVVKKVISEGDNYGRGEKKNKKINVEFVSAHPTGLLHVGTARGAAYGDSLCRILSFAGYDVTREYYINDAGVQIFHLGESVEARYKELLGLPFTLPEDGYHGEDVKDVAKQILEESGKELLSKPNHLQFFMQRGMEIELERIKKHLEEFRVTFDVFSSEKAIRSNDAIEKELTFLKPYTYEQDGAIYLRTTDFLDDKDRVVRKSDGDYTYFMPDIVYHVNKMSRGFDQLIDVLGADHHGYINRMKSALMMHGYKPESLEIELIQMVRFIKDGKEFKASKRAGDAITLKDICEEVGVDAMRYFFAMRAQSGHLDFDMDLAKEQSSNNPVYYAQYAHARLCSILEQGKDIPLDESGNLLSEESEMAILKHLASFNKAIEDAVRERAPFKITNYIHDLAELIHNFYSECRVIDRGNLVVSSSRLALCLACKIVLKNALGLVGVRAPEHMQAKGDNMKKPLIDHAYDLVSKQKDAVPFADIWNYVVKEEELSELGEEELASKAAHFYTNLLLDGRFVNLGDNLWDLRTRHTFDKVHIDMHDVYSDVEEVDDDEEEEIEEKEYNEAFEDKKDSDDEDAEINEEDRFEA